MKDNWDIDENIKDKYIKKCKLFVEKDEAFINFRQDYDYGKILEGNDRDIGAIALNEMTQHNGLNFIIENTPEFIKNDKIGNPQTYYLEIIDQAIAAATLRYINTAWEIMHLLGEFKPKRILEIGGGYGGLCRILSVLYDFKEYTNKDLPEAEALFNKYISYFPELDGRINNKIKGKYDLFIADSSLSECDKPTQLSYIEMAKSCEYIYLTYNTTHKPKYLVLKDKILKELDSYEIVKRPSSFSNTFLMRKK